MKFLGENICSWGVYMSINKVQACFFAAEMSDFPYLRELEAQGFEFFIFTTKEDRLTETISENLSFFIVDFSMICACGFSLLSRLKELNPSIPLFVISEEDSACIAVTALKHGADDYFVVPCNYQHLGNKIREKIYGLQPENLQDYIPEFVGQTQEMLEIKKQVYKYAKTDLPVLIIGESGTGKSFLAKLIHKYSNVKNLPFCEENMATIPEPLAESMLFGTKRGIYTGAENRKGLIESAENGTLFLDEISEASLGIQAKLLRVISEKSYRPLGSTEEKKTDVRLITASNANLEKAMENKTFREDLYYRINPLTVKIPPLDERKDDIPVLIQYFVERKNKEITYGAIDTLQNRSWKGNIRELESTLERAICLCSNNTITKEDLIFY